MIRVRWPDNTTDVACTWKELLGLIGTSRWETGTPNEVRQELRRRALRWSHTIVPTETSDRRFFQELERAGLCEVLSAEEEAAHD